MSTPAVVAVADRTTKTPVPTVQAVKLAGERNRRKSRHRMQRAARIYRGTTNARDKIASYPDKGWAMMLILGTLLVGYALGCASLLLLGM